MISQYTCQVQEIIIESYVKKPEPRLELRLQRSNMEFNTNFSSQKNSITISFKNMNHHHIYCSKLVSVNDVNDSDDTLVLNIPEYRTILKLPKLSACDSHSILTVLRQLVLTHDTENSNPNRLKLIQNSKFVPVSLVNKQVNLFDRKKVSSPLFMHKTKTTYNSSRSQSPIHCNLNRTSCGQHSGYTPDGKKCKQTASPNIKNPKSSSSVIKSPTIKSPNMTQNDITKEQREILDACCDSQTNIFFSGSAGTGKSSLLTLIIDELNVLHGKQSVFITATTGSAACKIGGTTVHQFAGLTIFNEDDPLERERVINQVLNTDIYKGLL